MISILLTVRLGERRTGRIPAAAKGLEETFWAIPIVSETVNNNKQVLLASGKISLRWGASPYQRK